MTTIEENIKRPEYRLLSSLVLGTEKELKKWEKRELNDLRTSVKPFIAEKSLDRYKKELAELVKQIKEGHAFYESDIAGLDRVCRWTTFPNQYKLYRDKIYALERQQAKVTAERKILEFKKVEAEHMEKKAKSKKSSSESTPKKSGIFKHFLAFAGITATLVGVFQWGRNSQKNSVPYESDKAPQTMTQKAENVDKTPQSDVGQRENTHQNPTTALRDRLEQAKILRQIKEEEAKIAQAELVKRRITHDQ